MEENFYRQYREVILFRGRTKLRRCERVHVIFLLNHYKLKGNLGVDYCKINSVCVRVSECARCFEGVWVQWWKETSDQSIFWKGYSFREFKAASHHYPSKAYPLTWALELRVG